MYTKAVRCKKCILFVYKKYINHASNLIRGFSFNSPKRILHLLNLLYHNSPLYSNIILCNSNSTSPQHTYTLLTSLWVCGSRRGGGGVYLLLCPHVYVIKTSVNSSPVHNITRLHNIKSTLLV